MTLIKRLGETEGVFCGEGCFPLEGGEVVKLRCDLLGGLFILGHDAGFSLATIGDEFGSLLVPDPLGATVRVGFVFLKSEIDPFGIVFAGGDAEGAVDFGIFGGGEGLDFLFALGVSFQRTSSVKHSLRQKLHHRRQQKSKG